MGREVTNTCTGGNKESPFILVNEWLAQSCGLDWTPQTVNKTSQATITHWYSFSVGH